MAPRKLGAMLRVRGSTGTAGKNEGMTQPAPGYGYRVAGPASLFVRLIAVAATIATLLAGFIIAFGSPSATSLKDWIATGLIGAGVALGCMIIL